MKIALKPAGFVNLVFSRPRGRFLIEARSVIPAGIPSSSLLDRMQPVDNGNTMPTCISAQFGSGY
jgi:hypothetical protein